MKLMDVKCPGCGAMMHVEDGARQAVCEYCGTAVPIDDEAVHVKIDGAAQAGYEFERGRQQAQAEFARQQQQAYASAQPVQQAPAKKRRTWLWVLGWIFLFPVPLTILMLRNESMPKAARYAIIAAAWIVYLAIGLAGKD